MSAGVHAGLELRQTGSLSMTPQLRQAIELLKFNNVELSAHLTKLAAANPMLTVLVEQPPPSPAPDSCRLPSGITAGSGAGGTDMTEATIAQPQQGLHAHVLQQISLNFAHPEDRGIAESFAEELEPSGWLRLGAAEVAQKAGCSTERATAVLERLQRIEPSGLFARNLAECLRLQARDEGLLNPAMSKMLDHLDLLARGALSALAKLCEVEQDQIGVLLRQIRGFDPKPGAAFGLSSAPIRPPDVIVSSAGADGWQVEMNHASAPCVMVHDVGETAFADGEAHRAALSEARWLMRVLSRRNATTIRIVKEVVVRQTDFLRDGPAKLKPLSYGDVAAALSLHESTISRVTTGLMVAVPNGTHPLRAFFSARLPSSGDGPPTSAAAVRHRIAHLVASEDTGHPLSDAALAQQLSEEGTLIARRTVAKYREVLHIPSSSARRRRNRLETHRATQRH